MKFYADKYLKINPFRTDYKNTTVVYYRTGTSKSTTLGPKHRAPQAAPRTPPHLAPALNVPPSHYPQAVKNHLLLYCMSDQVILVVLNPHQIFESKPYQLSHRISQLVVVGI